MFGQEGGQQHLVVAEWVSMVARGRAESEIELCVTQVGQTAGERDKTRV